MVHARNILIVDDDKLNQKALSYMLEKSYTLETASSGEEALKMIEGFTPNIVLLDIMMPGVNGYDVCREMRTVDSLRHTKIILVSARIQLEDRLKGYEVGADDYIKKPFDEDELKAKVDVFTRLNEQETLLRQLNRRLSLRQQDIPNILWDCDSNLLFTDVDENSEPLLGYTPEELIGKPITDFIAPEEAGEFYLKFQTDMSRLAPEIHGLSFTFVEKNGDRKPFQIFANAIQNEKGESEGMSGMFRDMGDFSQMAETVKTAASELTIRLNRQKQIVHATDIVKKYLNEEKAENPDFLPLLVDPTLENLLTFSFDQREDVPFPIETKFVNNEGEEHYFSIEFTYTPTGPYLEGTLTPIRVDTQLNLVSERIGNQEKKIQDQKEALENSVVIDSEMRESILLDTQNLTCEILSLIKELESYAYPEESGLDLEEFTAFLFNRNLQIYAENLRLLGNKIHGLKGSCGFILPVAKQLCHKVEDLTRPLAEQTLVFTTTISKLLKQFIFKVEEMLEQYQLDPDSKIDLGDWIETIEREIEHARSYIDGQVGQFNAIMKKRLTDHGEIRNREKEEYLSVSQKGYEQLADHVKELYYALSESLEDEKQILAGTLYNQFLGTHQHIKKITLNLTRYERLIPKLAGDYNKKAEFIFEDHQVKADLEFWNAIHEILNHMLKNSVIHGIETIEERENSGKSETGKILVTLKEDALHILLSISDDGKGIDIDKIKEKTVRNGTLTANQIDHMSEKEILNLVFIQGISTMDNLDDNAGRGVGMNAVLETTQHLKGSCEITNKLGEGCSWNFTFSKSNVSLPCVIITIGNLNLAIPEDYVETFIDYRNENRMTVKRKPVYRYDSELIPLVDSETLFNEGNTTRQTKQVDNSVIILKSGGNKKSLIIDEILHHAVLPILPLPVIYRNTPIYQGITIFKNNPIQVINVNEM